MALHRDATGGSPCGRRVHPAVNKHDQPGHSSLFTLLQETMFMKTHPSIYKKTPKTPIFENQYLNC